MRILQSGTCLFLGDLALPGVKAPPVTPFILRLISLLFISDEQKRGAALVGRGGIVVVPVRTTKVRKMSREYSDGSVLLWMDPTRLGRGSPASSC